jgi:DNA-binding MarR family transcriptional regulator
LLNTGLGERDDLSILGKAHSALHSYTAQFNLSVYLSMEYNSNMAQAKDIETAVDEFALAVGLLLRRVRAEAPSEAHDLSWTQKAVLVRLDKQGPATIAELARAEGVKPQSMSAAIALLEDQGMVERKADPADGRQMNIRLTVKGQAMHEATRDAKHRWLARTIAGLDKQEQAILFKAGEIIKQIAET